MKEITIIIVSYNVEKLLRRCIESIYRTAESKFFDIIVVDNNSRDNSVDMVRRTFPKVKLIQSDVNLGFSGANNLALRQVSTKYLLFLNPDTIVRNNAIKELMMFLDTNQNVGGVGPKIVNPDGSLQVSCKKLPGFVDALVYISSIGRAWPRIKMFRAGGLPNFDYQRAQKVERIPGACLMVRKEIFSDNEFFDERYFLYTEDTDLCMRMKINHWDVYYLSTAEVVHYGGQSSGRNGRWQESREMLKSRLKYRRKYHGVIYNIALNLLAVIIMLLKTAYLWLSSRQRNAKKIAMYLHLISWYTRNLVG